jgi:hypothetical protein
MVVRKPTSAPPRNPSSLWCAPCDETFEQMDYSDYVARPLSRIAGARDRFLFTGDTEDNRSGERVRPTVMAAIQAADEAFDLEPDDLGSAARSSRT